MTGSADHRLDISTTHAFWDNTLPPRITVKSGEVVEFDTVEASDNQIVPGITLDDLAKLDFSRIHPLTGPINVEGAEPGDTLQVELLGGDRLVVAVGEHRARHAAADVLITTDHKWPTAKVLGLAGSIKRL